jgi:hypothetical protein
MMTEKDLTEMYVHMADRDADASLEALQAYNAKREADAAKSIAGDTNENNSGQQKEKTGNST